MNPSDDKEQVMKADMANMKADAAPKKTWFFERMGDGKIFPCEEKEAWDICNNKSEWKRRDFRLLGTSDGTTYQRIIKESRAKADHLRPQVETLEKEVEKYSAMEDKYMMDNIVDMDDEEDPENAAHVKKVKKLQGIIEKKKEQLAGIKKEYQTLVSEAVKNATDAELEVARENHKKNGPDWPSQVNIITPDADPRQREKILNKISF